jgi:hypothetical protein
VNARRELDQHWAAYEDGLLAHLDAEETYLIPGLAVHDAELAARILKDHGRFRTQIAQVGIGLQLHVVREDQLRLLAGDLRAHAMMEEEPLYAWADANVSPSSFDAVVRRLLAGWRRRGSAPVPAAVSPSPRIYSA